MATSASTPQVLAWMICDGVHLDPGSGKHYLLGVFANICARQFPVAHPYMVWFLTLTSVQPGKHTLKISFGPNMEQLSEIITREFEAHHPNQRINLINEMRNFPFPAPADYQIQIEVDDEPLLVTNLLVMHQPH